MSEKIDELAKALCEVQKTIQHSSKDKTVSSGSYSYKYSDLATVIDTNKELLTKNGLSISQTMEPTDGTIASVTTVLMHTSGQYISSTMTIKPTVATPQGMGSAISYARRYAYSAIICIASEEDDDGSSASVWDKETVETVERNGMTITKPVNVPKDVCSQCLNEISPAVKKFSIGKYGKALCMDCQKIQ